MRRRLSHEGSSRDPFRVPYGFDVFGAGFFGFRRRFFTFWCPIVYIMVLTMLAILVVEASKQGPALSDRSLWQMNRTVHLRCCFGYFG